jgi:hypothetical protein
LQSNTPITTQSSTDESAQKEIIESNGELRAITLWDYQADDTSEISFDSNVIIHDVSKVSEGWWRGRVGNDIGLFPSNYVKIL